MSSLSVVKTQASPWSEHWLNDLMTSDLLECNGSMPRQAFADADAVPSKIRSGSRNVLLAFI